MSTKSKLVLTAVLAVAIIIISMISPRLTTGVIITGLAFLGLIYNEWLIRQVGSIGWAERHIRSEGGTRLILKLICIAAIMIGLLTMVGLHEKFLRWIFSPLIKYNQFGPTGK